jgi:hypothetical protein
MYVQKDIDGSYGRSSLNFIYLFIYLFIYNYSSIHMCIHCLGHFSLPFPPHFQAEPILPLSLILLKTRHKHNKGDKAFLLAELRIAIQKYS